MKTPLIARFLSIVLICTLSVCAAPVVLAESSNAVEVTVDYTALEDKVKLTVDDYYTKLGMHDGAGLSISQGLVPDGDWWWQLNNIDTAVTEKTGAFAVWDVVSESDFTAVFSTSAASKSVSFYVSEDYITWQAARLSVTGKTVIATVPENAVYVKAVWPKGDSAENKLISVKYSGGAVGTHFKRFDYATASSFTLNNGALSEQSLEANGVWETEGMSRSGTVLSADYTKLSAAVNENSYNGYVTYKVQPDTRFSLTVTTMRTATEDGTATNRTDDVAEALGYENPLDWNFEIYISSDNINFTRFTEVNASYSARYANNSPEGNACRSTDYNFIVPENAIYVKCKLPFTKSLKGTKNSSGEIVWSYDGNDFFSINRVEFTEPDFASEYTYYSVSSDDSQIKSALSEENRGNFGLYSYNGLVYSSDSKDSKGLNVDFYFLYGGSYGAFATYKVKKGTSFYSGIKIQYPAGLSGYIDEKGSYSLILQGRTAESGEWSNINTLEFNSENYNVGKTDYCFYLSAQANKYDYLRLYWPNSYSVNEYFPGNDLACIANVALTHFDASDFTDGDFNSDGVFNILDLVRYKKILAGTVRDGVLNTDLDLNGKADSADLVMLKKYLLELTVDTKCYSFDGNISLEVLNNYLDRAISYGFDIKNFNEASVDEGIRLITNVGAKYVQRAAGEWVPDVATEENYGKMTEKIAEAHRADPDIIFEAAIFETAGGNVQKFRIPQDVADLFGVSERGGHLFWEGNMLFDDNDGVTNNGAGYWGGGCHLPDITKAETQMFVYYKACKYIDMGFEALHLGQTGLTGLADTDNAAWEKVIDLIREYAAEHARRHYVLINSHDKLDFTDSDGVRLVDFIMAPSRVIAALSEENHSASEENPQKCDIYYGYADSVYNAGISGTSPGGWYSEKYPYLVEFDNYSVGETDTSDKTVYVWGRDEIGWFAAQPSWYRTYFMKHITDKVHSYCDNGHVALPVNRGGGYYANNKSEACPNGTGEEEAVKLILSKQH